MTSQEKRESRLHVLALNGSHPWALHAPHPILFRLLPPPLSQLVNM